MKKFLVVLGFLVMMSCVGTKSAVSYHYVPKINQDECVGKITQIVKTQGYSIISVEKPNTLIYVCGKLDATNKPYLSPAYIKVEKDRKHFVYEGKRYGIDLEKSKI